MRLTSAFGLCLLVAAIGTGCRPTAGSGVVGTPVEIATSPKQRFSPFDEEQILKEIQRLCAPDFAGRGSYQKGSALASQYLFEEFETLGYEMHRQPVHGHAETIIAVKRGDSQAVMVSAHHDHLGVRDGELYLGADDNASGVAALMAIARSSANSSYRHTVIFVSFGAEEDGLVGSAAYVRDPFWPLADTKAVVNFDMVGRNFFEAGANQAAAVAVVGLEGDSVAQNATVLAAKQQGLSVIEVPARLLEIFYLHDRTDDWWFRRQGIPAIHFSTGMHQDYHQPTDTVEKLVLGQVSKIAETAASTLDSLAQIER